MKEMEISHSYYNGFTQMGSQASPLLLKRKGGEDIKISRRYFLSKRKGLKDWDKDREITEQVLSHEKKTQHREIN